jgi:hypothetical protein
MLIKHGDGQILTVVKSAEDIEQAKKLAEQAQTAIAEAANQTTTEKSKKETN